MKSAQMLFATGKKILVFSGSNSPQSINQQLATYANSLLEQFASTLINLRDYTLPVYSDELEESGGIPEPAAQLRELIASHDALIISTPEHNSSIPAVLKNTLDWISRAGEDYRALMHKPILLLGTSPGRDGARKAIGHAADILSELAGDIFCQWSLPSFSRNVVLDENGFRIINETLSNELHQHIRAFEDYLSEECPFCITQGSENATT